MLRTSRRDRRRGNILIVTLALLALMAIVGLTAVYYTRDQAERARIQGQPKGGGEGFSADGTAPATHFLRVLLYDDNDYGTALLNSVRGHSLTATMYGRKPGANIAWNGPGTFGGSTITQYNLIDRRLAVNHQVFPGVSTIIDPEYDTARTPGTTPPGYAGTYYGKNPPYTYPDIKDYYLASICPATGEVLLPSFYRPQTFGPLTSGNANWTNGNGRFLIGRPTKDVHPNFPPVPANQDGTVTGDVQNLPGGFFTSTSGQPAVAHNDSIWIDTGLPAFSLPNGKRVKPLIAPLILDLDGRLNLNVHGNAMNGGAHASGQGFGPWEVSLERALNAMPTGTADARALVNARGQAQTRSWPGPGPQSRAFAPRLTSGNELPKYAQVAWSGFNAANPFALPTATATSYPTDPAYTGGYNWTNAAAPSHPSLYNPYEWGATGATKAFPFTDMKVLAQRYAPYPYDLSQSSFASLTAPSLMGNQGTYALTNPNPPASTTPPPTGKQNYRLDPAHANRMLFTTASNALHRSMLMPGYDSSKTPPSLPADPNASATGLYLGALDLNRTLVDYRMPGKESQPLSPSTVDVTSAGKADQDRQTFAMDIFTRLVAACGDSGTATINPTTGFVTVVDTTKARTLAQLAVNIVDYIDNDDISTAFVWNPQDPTDPRNAVNFGAGELTNRVVFGVEKPRLVINEAYAEVVNDPTDEPFTDTANGKAMKELLVRFWVELQNPTHKPHTADATAPLGDGSVSFGGTNPYILEIVQNTKVASGVAQRLRGAAADPTNVTGDSGVTANLTYTFSSAPPNFKVPAADGAPTGGILVLAADSTAPDPTKVSAMDWLGYSYTSPGGTPAPQKLDGATAGMPNSLTYTIPIPVDTDVDKLHDASDPTIGKPISRHVVLLRRLANPYVATSATNPYVTVDVLDHVNAADRVMVAKTKKYTEKRASGYDTSTQSVGKVQPYTSYSDPALTTSDPKKPTATALAYPGNSMVLQQTATPTAPLVVKQTLGRQNSQNSSPPAGTTTPVAGGETIQTPFDWLVHLDRPLVNQVELLHVSTGRPHDLTYNFIQPSAPGSKYTGSMQTAVLATSATPPLNQLYRALDLLTVQPYGHQRAFGGRVPGLININTIQDKRVFDALFDAQNNGFNQAFVDNLWNKLMATRTVNMSTRTDATGTNPAWSCPVPAATVYDTGSVTGTPNPDRPFLPFGVVTIATSGATFANGVGINDTLLRIDTTATPPAPYIAVPPVTGHPYQQAEALRKILNNTTTVSHTFAVWITVGYFEVDTTAVGGGERPAPSAANNVGTFVTLGKEYYINAPGDTRKKFFALVDRSNIGYKPSEALVAPTPAGTPYTQVDTPFFTTVEENAPAGGTIKVSSGGGGNVYSDGVAVPLNGASIAIGVGANREIVTVSNAVDSGGVATLTVNPPLTKQHYAGEVVSNIVPGNPGVPTDFDPTIAKYKAVVPLWVKLP